MASVDVDNSKVGMLATPSRRREVYSALARSNKENLSSDVVHFSNERCRSRLEIR